MFNGDYVQSLAASSNAILAVTRNASGGSPTIHQVNLAAGSTDSPAESGRISKSSQFELRDGGFSQRLFHLYGRLGRQHLLYDANSNTFTVSRKDFTALSGAYAASNFNQYVVGNNLLDSSLVPVAQLETESGSPSGFCIR